ncbi:hypothetical protein ACRALDRAFT_2025772 [Sodiomyces alcalophilus JCM 7366]|uniref:uncharacterized protein n=1 Tax=Sodiomyces alcalophilus JCM 7366 TaxID=591952 RepID=UPI0039B5E27E
MTYYYSSRCPATPASTGGSPVISTKYPVYPGEASSPSEAPALVRQPSDASSFGPATPISPRSPAMSYTSRSTSQMPTISYRTSACHDQPQPQSTTAVDWNKYNYVASDDGGYWELKPQYAYQGCGPARIPHSKPAGHQHRSPGITAGDGAETRYTCLWPGCPAKPFKRHADLQRHYAQVHLDSSSRESYTCDYPKCARRSEPFGRLDHFRDHLRDYHQEDICKRGGQVDDKWLKGRKVSSRWWRCTKCLSRVDVSKASDCICPRCKMPCEDKRKRVRGWR